MDTNISASMSTECRPVSGTGLTDCCFHSLSRWLLRSKKFSQAVLKELSLFCFCFNLTCLRVQLDRLFYNTPNSICLAVQGVWHTFQIGFSFSCHEVCSQKIVIMELEMWAENVSPPESLTVPSLGSMGGR